MKTPIGNWGNADFTAFFLFVCCWGSCFAGEPQGDEKKPLELWVERGDVVSLLAFSDELEQHWLERSDSTSYSDAVVPLCELIHTSKKFHSATGVVLIEISRRLIQKEEAGLLPSKRRLMMSLMATPKGLLLAKPEEREGYRASVAHFSAIVMRQARDAIDPDFDATTERPRGGENTIGEAVDAEVASAPAAGRRRIQLVSRRILQSMPLSFSSFLVDWYGRKPVEATQAQEVALLFGLEPALRDKALAQLSGAERKIEPVVRLESMDVTGGDFHAAVVEALNAIKASDQEAEAKHVLRQQIAAVVVGKGMPSQPVSALLVCKSLLAEPLPDAGRDVKAQTDWCRRRQRDARLAIALFSACRRERLSPSKIRELEVEANVPPELRGFGTSLAAIDAKSISDPALRAVYDRLMAEQSQRENLADQQAGIATILTDWPKKVEAFLTAAYARPPFVTTNWWS